METIETICEFWFGREPEDAAAAAAQAHIWWGKEAALDSEIRRRFEPCVLQAARRELDSWLQMPEGRLALILLTDQFPRNIYRNDARAFAFDALARDWCKEGLAQGAHRQLRSIERVFFYLPLEHSETLSDQAQARELFGELLEEVGPELKPVFSGFLGFARAHYKIIEQYGRFPHRNAILSRASTAEEIAFLQQPNSSF